MRYSKLLLVSTIMAAGSAYAAIPTINVSGKILPPACSANMVGGDNMVWDPISHNELSDTNFTLLVAQEATLQVHCADGLKTHVAFWAIDANPSSAVPGAKVPGTNLPNGNVTDRIFGIGVDPVTGGKIGNFTLIGKSSSYDGTVNDNNYGYNTSKTSNTFALASFGNGYRFAEEWTVVEEGTNNPASANAFTFVFDVVPQINIKRLISNNEEVDFAGSAQFFVRYF